MIPYGQQMAQQPGDTGMFAFGFGRVLKKSVEKIFKNQKFFPFGDGMAAGKTGFVEMGENPWDARAFCTVRNVSARIQKPFGLMTACNK